MQLGFKPDNLRLVLTTGADFQSTLELSSGTFGTGVLSLKFQDGTSWTATMTPTTATFAVDKAQADLQPDGSTVRLNYTDGTTDLTWALGAVTRVG